MELVERLAGALQQASQISGLAWPAETLVVGVSGGPDSAALLHALRQLLPPTALIVAHFDHGLRPGSAGEAEQVAMMAGGLRFRAGRADVAAQARAGRLSLEEAGRVARYDFLAGVARAERAKAVAVGHNADDQAETILMHVLRGSGTAGLRGMTTATPLPGHADLWLWRPLLAITRQEIEAYCREHQLAVINDPTNSDQTYLRNRLRHDLLPALERANPRLRDRLREMAQVVAADEELAVAETGHTGARAALPGGLTLFVGYDSLLLAGELLPAVGEYPQLLSAEPVPLPVPGALDLAGGWRITAEWAVADLFTITANDDSWTASIAATAATELHVRGRREGEWLRPLGLEGETRLKEIMINRKIPAHARALWPVVANHEHAVWLPGHVLDDRAQVMSDDGRVVRLWCRRLGEGEPG